MHRPLKIAMATVTLKKQLVSFCFRHEKKSSLPDMLWRCDFSLPQGVTQVLMCDVLCNQLMLWRCGRSTGQYLPDGRTFRWEFCPLPWAWLSLLQWSGITDFRFSYIAKGFIVLVCLGLSLGAIAWVAWYFINYIAFIVLVDAVLGMNS